MLQTEEYSPPTSAAGRPRGELEQTNGTLDLHLGRDFRLSQGRLHVFAQIINLTNRTNVIAVSTSIFNPGAPTNVDIPREVQFGIDVRF